MNYRQIQMMHELFKDSRVSYHLAMAAAAAKEDGDRRMSDIIGLMTTQEREAAKQAIGAKRSR